MAAVSWSVVTLPSARLRMGKPGRADLESGLGRRLPVGGPKAADWHAARARPAQPPAQRQATGRALPAKAPAVRHGPSPPLPESRLAPGAVALVSLCACISIALVSPCAHRRPVLRSTRVHSTASRCAWSYRSAICADSRVVKGIIFTSSKL